MMENAKKILKIIKMMLWDKENAATETEDGGSETTRYEIEFHINFISNHRTTTDMKKGISEMIPHFHINP